MERGVPASVGAQTEVDANRGGLAAKDIAEVATHCGIARREGLAPVVFAHGTGMVVRLLDLQFGLPGAGDRALIRVMDSSGPVDGAVWVAGDAHLGDLQIATVA